MAQRKKPIKKAVIVRDKELTLLDYHAIQLHELFQAYKRAGFDHGTAITLVLEKDSHPSWFKDTTMGEFRKWDELEDDGEDD